MKSTTSKDLSLPIEPLNAELFELFLNYLKTSKERPVLKPLDEESITRRISNLINNDGIGTSKFIKLLDEFIMANSMNLHNPMYMGHQVPPTLPLASLLDLIISCMNQSNAVTKMSPVLSEVERDLIRFLCSQIGYSSEAGGTVTSGGSISNLLGIYGARKRYFPGDIPENAVIICSDQSHFSVSKAANIIGISHNKIYNVETDNSYSLNIDKIRHLIKDLKNQGIRPFVISANAGSTSTGSFDNLEELSNIAQENDIWLHIDGAHGTSLVFSSKLKHLIKGIEKADSISWDGHKMMFLPSSLGLAIFKNVNELKNCFKDNQAPYLYNSKESENDLSKLSIQCTKRGDSLKMWGCLVAYGTDFFAERLEHLYDVTQYFYNKVLEHECLEALHKPMFNIFCFRYNPRNKNLNDQQLNDLNAQIRDIANNTGDLMITLTSIKGIITLRVTIINPATTNDHIDKLINIIESSIPEI